MKFGCFTLTDADPVAQTHGIALASKQKMGMNVVGSMNRGPLCGCPFNYSHTIWGLF